MCVFVRVREYIGEIQKEILLEGEIKRGHRVVSEPTKVDGVASAGQNKNDMKAVMDRMESRKLVDILSKEWDTPGNQDLVDLLLQNRIKYSEQHEMPAARVEELDEYSDEDELDAERSGVSSSASVLDMEKDTPFEALREFMVDDICELYNRELAEEGQVAERIMDMMDEKYQLKAVEKKLRGYNSTFCKL